MTSNISAIILAGGANTRLNGLIKSNMIIGGSSILSRMVEVIGDLFEEIVIVTNTPEEFKEYFNYKIISDIYKKKGPLGGIHAALRATSAEALFVFAGDMPLLDRKLIMKQINLYEISACDILLPCIKGSIEPLHAIYKSSVLNTLENYLICDNNCAVRDFFKMVKVIGMELEESQETINAFTNINLPSDIIKVEKKLRSG